MNKTIEGKIGNKLSIKPFVLSEECKNPIIVMIAKRNSGISWVCREGIEKFMEEFDKNQSKTDVN